MKGNGMPYNLDQHHRWSIRVPAYDYASLGAYPVTICWLEDESLEDTESLPAPDVLAGQIVENLQAALGHVGSICEALEGKWV
jgi:hypothetical protein